MTWSALMTFVVGFAAGAFLVAANEPAEIFCLLRDAAGWGMLAVLALRLPQVLLIYPGKLTRAETFRIGCIGALDPLDFERLLVAVAETVETMRTE